MLKLSSRPWTFLQRKKCLHRRMSGPSYLGLYLSKFESDEVHVSTTGGGFDANMREPESPIANSCDDREIEQT
jgi:hypothetical protein